MFRALRTQSHFVAHLAAFLEKVTGLRRLKSPWLPLLGVGLAAVTTSNSVHAQPQLRIEAQSRFERIAVTARGDRIEVRGQLVDDNGTPLAQMPLTVRFSSMRAGRASLQPCSARTSRTQRARLTLQTDKNGHFCLSTSKTPAPSRAPKLILAFAGDRYHKSTTLAVSPTPTVLRPSLRFTNPIVEFKLGQSVQNLSLDLNLPPASASASNEHRHVELALVGNGSSTNLGSQPVAEGDSTVEFSVNTARVGAPGPGRLVAVLHSPDAPPATAQAVLMRTVIVELSLVSTEGSSKGGFEGASTAFVELQFATSTGLRHPAQGFIRVWSNSALRAQSSPLRGGIATVVLPRLNITDRNALDEELLIEFVPSAPGWLPGTALPLSLSEALSSSHQWLWLLLLAAVILTCLPRRRHKPRPLASPVPRPSASTMRPLSGISLRPLAPANGFEGWLGHVRDAHDGQPICPALLELTVPNFRGAETVLQARTNKAGQFELSAAGFALQDGIALRVRAPQHSTLTCELPLYRELNLVLSSRRRTLLEHLLRWGIGQKSGVLKSTDEPTPSQILSAIDPIEDPDTAAWTQKMREQIYGPVPVDAETEAKLLESEPNPCRFPPQL